jgi:hypothetical protein
MNFPSLIGDSVWLRVYLTLLPVFDSTHFDSEMDKYKNPRNDKGQPKEDTSSSPDSSASLDSSLAHIVTTGIEHPGKNGTIRVAI